MVQRRNKKIHVTLWIIQIILALLYLNAGYLKTFKPIGEIVPAIFWAASVPEGLVRFIGISELLGGIGLIVPAATGIRPQLSLYAAVGLTMIMAGANIFHIFRGEFFVLPMTGILLALCAFTAYGRWKLAPFIIKEQ